jgi:TonB family protein
MIRRVLLSTVCLLGCIGVDDALAQARAVQARDGDIILVPADATITVARGIAGHIRVTAPQQGQLLVVMVDEGPNPDGIVDFFHRFDLTQPLPPQYLFDGPGTYEEYQMLGQQRVMPRYGIVLPQGRIFLVSGSPAPATGAVPEHIAALEFRGSSSRKVRATFDDAEREALGGPSSTGMRASVQMGVVGVPGGIVGMATAPSPPDAPVRVGGPVRQPVKIKDVPAVLPDIARSARIQGVVILEVTIDAQGRVSNARVLRSIPLLDQAALDAVRQWEYEPTLLNGVPVPVIMTVTVPFSSQ